MNWAGLFALLSTTLMASPVSATAGVLGTRSSTLNNSKGAATNVTSTFLVTPGTSATIKGVKFSLCTSPLLSVSCASPAGATLAAATAGSQLKNAGAITNPYASPAYTSTTDVCFTNATGNAFNGSSDTFTFPLQVISLPTAVNTQFYFREQTFSSADCTTTAVDFGGFAESTTQQLSVTASVQENLAFCVGNANPSGTCASIGTGTVTLSPSVMTTSAPSIGNAWMMVTTNAGTGYVITYNATSFTDTTSDTITAAPSGGAALGAGGSEQFGFNLVANSGGNFGTFGAAPTNSGAATSPYGTNNQVAYNTAGATQVASFGSPTASPQTYTISYGANVAATTKAGVYTSTQTFIATGTF